MFSLLLGVVLGFVVTVMCVLILGYIFDKLSLD